MSETETIDVVSPKHADSSPLDIRTALLARASVSSDYADLTRMIGRGRQVRLPQLGDDAVLSLHLPVAERQIADAEALTLVGSSGLFVLEQGMRLMRALTGIDLSSEQDTFAERWEWLQAALTGRLAGTPFDFADRILRGTQTDAASAFMLRFNLRTRHHAIITYANAGIAVWREILAKGDWEQERIPAQEYLDLPFAASIGIAKHTLPAQALRRLTVGDIVLPSSSGFTCNGEGLLQIAGLNVRVRYRAPCTLEIIAREGKLGSTEWENNILHASENEENAGTPAPDQVQDDLSGLSAVSVTLDFELGQVRMLLGEMRALGAGTILTLTGGSPSSIAIRSAGHILGRGEAVDVNGRLGIRITEWRKAE